MDDFLNTLYEEEREKIAAADLSDFMSTLQSDELEEFLGLRKVAVAGPEEAELPTAEKGRLAKDQGKADKEVAQIQGQEAANRKEAMVRRIEKIAAFKTRKLRESGILRAASKTAAAKAKIISRSMWVTQGAPQHIKTASARLAGRAIAKLAAEDDAKYRVVPGSWRSGQKGMVRAMRRPGSVGLDKYIADPQLIGERQIGSMKGGLKGGGIGAGVGTLLGAGASALSKGRLSPLEGAGIGAALGGLTGLSVGQGVGAYNADKRFLANRGIKVTRAGFGRGKFTEEAAKKYLKEG